MILSDRKLIVQYMYKYIIIYVDWSTTLISPLPINVIKIRKHMYMYHSDTGIQ